MGKRFRRFFDSDAGLLVIALLIACCLWIYTGIEKVQEQRKEEGAAPVLKIESIKDYFTLR